MMVGASKGHREQKIPEVANWQRASKLTFREMHPDEGESIVVDVRWI